MHILILMLTACAVGVSADDPPPQSDQDKSQGTWIVEKQEWGRLIKLLTDDLPQVTELDIKGDACTMVSRDSSTDPEERHKLTMTLDAKQTPGHMDLVLDANKPGFKAIYRFDKEDSLTIAVGVRDDYRPKGFDPNKELIFVLVLKKKKT